MTMRRAVFSLLFVALLSVWSASAQTTEFTYQGSLKDGSTAANGNYDFQFLLFDAASGGTQKGGVVARTLPVADGIFTTTLDFGNQYDGSARFLEIRVRKSGDPSFTPLTPRQPVNSTPHAVKALSATQLNGVDSGQYVLTTDERLVNSRPPLAGSFFYIQNSTARQGFTNFNVDIGMADVFNTLVRLEFQGRRLFHVGNPTFHNLYFGFNSGDSENGTNRATYFGNETGRFNTFGDDTSFFGYQAGRANTLGKQNSFFGSTAGLRNTEGNNNTFFGFQSGNANTTGSGNAFFGTNSGLGNTLGSNNTLVGFDVDVAAGGLQFATAIGSGSRVDANNTVVLGRPADTVRIPGPLNVLGNVSIGGTLTANNLIVPATSITGILTADKGGTGIGSPGATGNFLRSTGTDWASSPITASDFPAGNVNYIQNGTSPQSASNFNISGNGTIGGTLAAGAVNATTQFNLGGNRFLAGGSNNFFAGLGAGSATTGGSNTFVGTNAGQANVAGGSNTLLGFGTNVGSGGLNFATAIGAGAIVNASNAVVLGRSTDAVSVPGALSVSGNTSVGGNLSVTGTISGSFAASSLSGVVAPANGGTGFSGAGTSGNFLRSNGTIWQPATITAGDIPNLGATYIQNGSAVQTASFNVSGNGTIGGNLTVVGTLNAALPAADITGTLAANKGGTGLSAPGTTGNFLRSNGTAWQSQGLVASDIPSLAANYIQNGTAAQAGANFNITGNGTVGGNLTVNGTLNGTFSVNASNLAGVVGVTNGGTGLSGVGGNGAFLRSNGSALAYSGLSAGDLPSGSGNYIQNGTVAQTGNFNVSGNGTVGGTLSANAVNSTTQFNLNGNRILGDNNNNLFVGVGAGTGTTGQRNTMAGSSAGGNTTSGDDNVFVGRNAGLANVSGTSNTVVGSTANLGANNLQFATAIGANSVVGANDTIVIGKAAGTYNGNPRPADSVVIPGTLAVNTLASVSGGITAICLDAANKIAGCSSSARYKYNVNPFSSGLDLVRKLRPVSFNWRANGMADMGLVAEEVAAAEPLLVSRNANGQVEGVKYDRVGVVLLNAVKEQQGQIESLQKEVDDRKVSEADLKDRLAKQQAELDALKKLVCAQNQGAAVCR